MKTFIFLVTGILLLSGSFQMNVSGDTDTFGIGILDNQISEPDLILEGIIGEVGVDTVYENLTILLNNSWAWSYGNVTFRNVTLIMKTLGYLANLGNITITDLDSNPETTSDNSRVLGNKSISNSNLINYQYPATLNLSNTFFQEVNINNEISPPGQISMVGCVLNDTSMTTSNNKIINCRFNNSRMDISRSNVLNTSFLNSQTAFHSTILNDLSMTGSSLRLRSDMEVDEVSMTGNEFFKNIAMDLTGEFFGHLKNISIENYNLGILKESGGLELMNGSLKDCGTGIASISSTNVYLVSVEIIENDFPIQADGLVSVERSMFSGGMINMNDHALLSHFSSFQNMEGIKDIRSGYMRNSTFENIELGLLSPTGTTITGNLFKDCEIAISQPTGCLIFHNSFIDNLDIDDGSPSTGWYNSELEEGNFYSTYEGSDDGSNDRASHDGIGDTDVPYFGRDLYPFMKDLAWNMPDIPEPTLFHQFGTGIVDLSWDSDENVGSFVQRSSSPSFTSDLRTWSIKNNNISIDNNPNSTQFFRITVYNDIGFRGWSSPKSVTIDQAPLAPIDVVVDNVDSGGSLKVSWNHVGEDIERTFVFYASRNFTPSHREVFYPMNEIVIDGLDNEVEYSIFLLTEDSSGQVSDLTENFTGKPVDIVPPPPPKNLRSDVISNTSIEIFWDPPGIQDISGYQIFRKGPDDNSLKFIRKVSRLLLNFEDTGLEDNTSYLYGIRSIDDDGPYSVMSEVLEVTTFHYNRGPEFNGKHQVISLVEDQKGIEIPVNEISFDPDGDQVLTKVEDTFRVDAEISGDLLLVEPRKDEAGIGFIKLQATDGEATTFFIIDILIEQVSDPPANVRILYPVNGSVFLPDSPVLLRGEAFDADTIHGDQLTYRWISSVDGNLNGGGSSLHYTNVILSSGLHVITMEVFDSNNTVITRNVTVMVSLWGWSEMPWSVVFLDGKAHENGGKFTVRIENDSPIFLMFTLGADSELDPELFGERGMIVSASSTGDIDIPFRLDSGGEDKVTITLIVRAESPNGTYAGTTSIEFDLKVEEIDENVEPPYLMIALIVISALIALVGVILFLTLRRFGYRMKVNEKIEKDDTNQEDGAKDGTG